MICPTGQTLIPNANLHTGGDVEYSCADLSKLYQGNSSGFTDPNVVTVSPPVGNSFNWLIPGLVLGLIVFLYIREG